MKYFFIVLICLPISVMAQSVSVPKDTPIVQQNRFPISLIKWENMTASEQESAITLSDIKEALKRKGYYRGKIKNRWDKKSQKAFTNYQIDVGLPPFPHARLDHFQALGLIERN